MAAFFHDILLLEEDALVQVGVEVGLHPDIGHVRGPADKMVHAFLGPVGIVDLEPVTFGDDLVADGLQRLGGLAGQERRRLLVAVDAVSHEVVGPEIADFQDGVRHDIGDEDKVTAVFGRGDGFLFPAAGEDAAEKKENGGPGA